MSSLNEVEAPEQAATLDGELKNMLYSCERIEDQLGRAYDCWRNDPALEGPVKYSDLFTIETDLKRIKANVQRMIDHAYKP